MGKGLLIVVLGFATIFSGYVYHFNIQQKNAQEIIRLELEQLLAKNASESAANLATSRAYRNLSVPDTGMFGDVAYIVDVFDVTGDSVNNVEKDSIVITSEYNDLTDISWVIMMRPAYSYYQYFHDGSWPDHVQYGSGDVIAGPVHCNDRLTGISNDPTFFGKVSSNDSDESGLTNAVYHAGLELGTRNISFAPGDIAPIWNKAISIGRVLSNPDTLFITFNNDGTYDYQQGGLIGNENLIATNGLIIDTDVNRPVIINAGTLNGTVTVIGADVHVRGTVTYAGSDDYLGIVAADDFSIWYPDGTSVINLEAAIMALDKFELINDNDLVVSSLSVFEFNFTGSLSVGEDQCRGDLVTMGNDIAFLNRTHSYDQRLRSHTPPYFPRTARKEILSRKN